MRWTQRVRSAKASGSSAFFSAAGRGVPNEQDLVNETRKTYAGPLVVGEDLMTFFVGKKDVTYKQN